MAEPGETALALTRKAAAHLDASGIENARLDAELLLAGVLGTTRLQLYLEHDRPVSEEQLQQFRAHVRRRLRNEPVQYILGDAAFRGLTLNVDRRALIPRPETELLVGEVLRWIAALPDLSSSAVPDPRLDGEAGGTGVGYSALDIGTGTGAIALSLLAEGPFARVVATDVSDLALQLAADNAQRSGLRERLELRSGSVWECVTAHERFDVIVSNPPYIGEHDRDGVAPNVRDWEPDTALFSGAQGTDVLHEIVDRAAAHLKVGGLLALEVGETQASGIAQRALQCGFEAARIVNDYTGRERMVLATARRTATGQEGLGANARTDV